MWIKKYSTSIWLRKKMPADELCGGVVGKLFFAHAWGQVNACRRASLSAVVVSINWLAGVQLACTSAEPGYGAGATALKGQQ